MLLRLQRARLHRARLHRARLLSIRDATTVTNGIELLTAVTIVVIATASSLRSSSNRLVPFKRLSPDVRQTSISSLRGRSIDPQDMSL